jgi:DNA-binding CsgD family transcriptional regulator
MLHERAPELSCLAAALSAADPGAPTVTVLSGPLGIGRTALLRELPGTLAGEDVRVLRANAAPAEQHFAYGVVGQLLDSLLSGASRQDRERWRNRQGPAERLMSGIDDPAAFEAGRASPEALRPLLADFCGDARLLILLDDLQWSDTASLRWLARLVQEPEDLCAALVCSLRDGDQGTGHALVRYLSDSAAQTLRLAPLSPDATRAVIDEHCGPGAHEEYVRACHEAARGNPLFLTSILLDTAASGGTPTAEQARLVRTVRPAGLRERLASYLRTGPQAVRDTASAVAALGGHGATGLVPELAGLDESSFKAARRALCEAGLLADVPEPRFTHPAVREAVESALSVVEREHWHAAAADLLYSSGRPADQVADHMMDVTASGRPWSVMALRAAAEDALRRGAPENAACYLRRALLGHRTQDESRAALLIELATAEGSFDPEACRRHVVQALPLLTTARDRAAAVLRIPPRLLGAADSSTSELWRDALEETAPFAGEDAQARETALRLEARMRHCGHENPGELAAATERLRGLGDQPPVGSAAERELLTVLLFSATLVGGLPAADAARTAGLVLEREPAVPGGAHTVLPLAVITLFTTESVREVASWLSAAQRPGVPHATDADGVLLFAARAFVLVSQGRPTLAREYVERVMTSADRDWREASMMILTTVAVELRDTALSERILARARRRGATGLALTASLQILQASVDAQRGLRATALERLLACGRQLDHSGWRNSALFPWRPQAVGLYQRRGDAAAALRLAEEELVWATEWGAPAALGRALRLKGRLQGARGIPLLRDAATVLSGSQFRLELARTLVLLGRQLGSGTEAEAALREAGAIAAAYGAPWLVEQAEHGLGTARAPRATHLTRSERKVIAQVNRGLTNQEIADELGVSSRAVEKHLTNSYRKLGISGRHELAGALPA